MDDRLPSRASPRLPAAPRLGDPSRVIRVSRIAARPASGAAIVSFLLLAMGCASPTAHPSAEIPAGHESAAASPAPGGDLPYELQLERVVGTYGSGPGQMAYPEGVAVDDLGRLFVADTGNNRIERFDQAGVFLGEFGGFGFGEGQFD